MAASQNKGKATAPAEIELRPDGWERFRQAVHAAAKSGPKHRASLKAKERSASKGRVHKGKTRS
jgi:hypothetical protein